MNKHLAIYWGITALIGCGSDAAKPDLGGSAVPSGAPAVTASAPASAAPSATADARPTATASSDAAPAKQPPRTGRPSAAAWCRAPKLFVVSRPGDDEGGSSQGCAYIEVEEWIMVACPAAYPLGTYTHAIPGGGSSATDEEILAGPAIGNTDAIVISLRPGTKASPLFGYRPLEHPDWMKNETFTFEMPSDGDELSDRILPTAIETQDRDTSDCGRFEKAAPPPKEEPKEIDDVEGQPPVPDDAAWDTEKEALVPGSDALGCKTKVKDGWFRARCGGKVTFTAVEVERERHKTQTVATVTDGKLEILTPYVENTSFRAAITYEGGTKFFKLTWRPGKRPLEVGRFDADR